MVGSLALMLLLGMVVVGNGVIRYQQVASLAREGSRYAAVNNSSQPSASALKTHIATYAAGMDISKLSCTVSTTGRGRSRSASRTHGPPRRSSPRPPCR